MNKIYYVLPISYKKRTKESVKEDYERFKRKNKSSLTFEEYLKGQRFNNLRSNISSFISSFHLTLEEAVKYAIENAGDINEAGCYNYVAVVAANVGYTYYFSDVYEEDVLLFKYNFEDGVYKQITESDEAWEPCMYEARQIWDPKSDKIEE